MITLEFGTIEAVKPPRVDVRLMSYNGESTIKNALVLSCGGQSTAGAASWFNFSTGDVVACLVDDERPENALILGGVYGDAQTVPAGSGVGVETFGDVKIKATSVWLGQKVDAPDCAKTCRDPLVQIQLSNIETALNGLISAFNLHTHPYVNVEAPATTSTIITPYGGSYTAGPTESNTVYVY